jgi:chorismate dehydratase
MSKRRPVRIGMVNFINTAPIYEVWKQTVYRPDWQIVAAAPSALNRMLYGGQLEIGCVSSHEYAVHPDCYEILADLSISASGPVGSVFLFARVEPAHLDGRIVLLSDQSQTSVSLVKIILEEFYGIKPHYRTGSVFEAPGRARESDAVLAIGDEALRLEGSREYPIWLDLGETWHHHTGLPFVFALWTVRQDFRKNNQPIVEEIHHELLRCLAEGRRHLKSISAAVAPRIPMNPAACLSYLQSMEYDLGPRKQQALDCFFEYLVKRREGAADALPLKIFQKQV